ELRKAILARFDSVAGLDRIISTHLLEANPTLSNPWGEANRQPGSGDRYVVVEGTDAGAVQWAGDQHFGSRAQLPHCEPISCGILPKPSLIADLSHKAHAGAPHCKAQTAPLALADRVE